MVKAGWKHFLSQVHYELLFHWLADPRLVFDDVAQAGKSNEGVQRRSWFWNVGKEMFRDGVQLLIAKVSYRG